MQEYSIIKMPNPKTERSKERDRVTWRYSVPFEVVRGTKSRSNEKRRVHLLSVAVSSQLIQHWDYLFTNAAVCISGRCTGWSQAPAALSVWYQSVRWETRICNPSFLLSPGAFLRYSVCIPMNLLHIYIRMQYTKLLKEIKIFFKIMVEVDAGIFYNKSAKSKGRKAKRKGQSYVVVTLSLLTQ